MNLFGMLIQNNTKQYSIFELSSKNYGKRKTRRIPSLCSMYGKYILGKTVMIKASTIMQRG